MGSAQGLPPDMVETPGHDVELRHLCVCKGTWCALLCAPLPLLPLLLYPLLPLPLLPLAWAAPVGLLPALLMYGINF